MNCITKATNRGGLDDGTFDSSYWHRPAECREKPNAVRLLCLARSATMPTGLRKQVRHAMAINLGDNEREAAWRQEVRDFIEKEAPGALRGVEMSESSMFGRFAAMKE